MVAKLDNLTSTSMGFALDAASLRHQVIATNIANVNTVGYVPKQLSFATQMEQLNAVYESASKNDGTPLPSLQLGITPVIGDNGVPAKVQLDMEMASMAQNYVHYQSLIKGLSRHYAILASAVSDGKK